MRGVAGCRDAEEFMLAEALKRSLLEGPGGQPPALEDAGSTQSTPGHSPPQPLPLLAGATNRMHLSILLLTSKESLPF